MWQRPRLSGGRRSGEPWHRQCRVPYSVGGSDRYVHAIGHLPIWQELLSIEWATMRVILRLARGMSAWRRLRCCCSAYGLPGLSSRDRPPFELDPQPSPAPLMTWPRGFGSTRAGDDMNLRSV